MKVFVKIEKSEGVRVKSVKLQSIEVSNLCCRVKLKNLKSQWRYVKDRIPGIETADLDDEDVVRQLGQDCQTRGVSPSCIKHLRLLKQFLVSLAAVRKGLSPPTFKSETFNFAAALEVDKSHGVLTRVC